MELKITDESEVGTNISKERVLNDVKDVGDKLSTFVDENFGQNSQLGIITTMASLQDKDDDGSLTGVTSSVVILGSPMACAVGLANSMVDFYQRVSKEEVSTSSLEDTIKMLGSIAANILAQRNH